MWKKQVEHYWHSSAFYDVLKWYNSSFKWWIIFLNSEFLCFTLLSNLVKKFLCQTPRRKANLEKTDLMHRTTYQFCILGSLDMCFGISIRKTMVICCLELFAWLFGDQFSLTIVLLYISGMLIMIIALNRGKLKFAKIPWFN